VDQAESYYSMDRVITATLGEILRQKVADLAGKTITLSGKSRLYFVENSQEEVYCVVVPHDSAQEKAELVTMARIVDDLIMIELDKTIPTLYDTLLEADIPDEQIRLAWQE